ncbi:MAG TPA: bile acid:sodium symporter family protein [Steroidobacteraceae bacterium]|nr:bile acid:sodium symporter family protein [Steroidobacteraceae bacterium]
MRLGRLRPDGFLLALLATVALASVWPEGGASGGPLHVDILSQLAVSLVFFLHGAQLPLESLSRGARNLRLHLVVQAFTFVAFPALGAVVLVFGGNLLTRGLGLGFFFLCTVSSTISSAVAMTAVAGGNVPGALFNATLSGVLGVVVTPLLVGFVADTADLAAPLPAAILSVALKVLSPLALGQLLRARLAGLLGRHRDAVVLADRGAIVLIVYGAFCDSFRAGIWGRSSASGLLAVIGIALLLFCAATVALIVLCRRLRLPVTDEIAAVFCGSQKSLANGLPIAKALFGTSPLLSLIVLPMMVYHQLQLTLGSVLARRYADASRRVVR